MDQDPSLGVSRYDTKRLNTKQLALTTLTGMLKYMAKLKDPRVAHDKLGRVNAPSGIEQYMTVQWDRLTPFPTSESLIHLAEKNTDLD